MDYYSVLGPIDPQIEDENGKFIPGMGYLYKYQDLVEKSENDEITTAELLFLTKRFDPALMFIIEQAKNHSEDLIKAWLPKYKFKNWKVTEKNKNKVTPKIKEARAARIAEILGNATKWHSHGRGITMKELSGPDIKLKIEDFGEDDDLNRIIRQYYDLFIDYGGKIGSEHAIHTRYYSHKIWHKEDLTMNEKKKVKDESRICELIKILELIEKSDVEDNSMFGFVVPYSTGRRPETVKWQNKGLQSKLP